MYEKTWRKILSINRPSSKPDYKKESRLILFGKKTNSEPEKNQEEIFFETILSLSKALPDDSTTTKLPQFWFVCKAFCYLDANCIFLVGDNVVHQVNRYFILKTRKRLE